MEISHIVPVDEGMFSCFDKNLILPLCRFWHVDATSYFLDYLLIRYTSADGTLLNNRDLYFGTDYKYDLLEKYAGIKRKRIIVTDENKQKCCEQIQQIVLDGQPVGVLLDSFYCDWNPYYQSMHREHAILLIDFEEQRMEFRCIDGYLTKEVQRIKPNAIYPGIYRVYIFEKKEISGDFFQEDHKKIIRSSLFEVGGGSTLESFEQIKEDILREDCFEKDKKSVKDLDRSHFMLRLRQISWNMRNIACTVLPQTGNSDKKLKMILSNKLLEQAGMWDRVIKYIAKAFYSNKTKEYLVLASKTVDKIILIEQEIYQLIQ